MTTLASLKQVTNKQEIYQFYQTIIDYTIDIEQITIEQMLETIKLFYNKKMNLAYCLNHYQIDLLERLLNKKEECKHYSIELVYLKKVFVVDFNNEIYDEIKNSVCEVIQYRHSKEGKEFFLLKEIIQGLTKAYGAIEKDTFFDLLFGYTDTHSKLEIENLLKQSHYFYHAVGYLKYNSIQGEKEFITDANVDLVYQFLNEFEESLLLSKKKFTLDEILELAHYGILYSNSHLQEVLDSLYQVDIHFNLEKLIECITCNIHLLGTGKKIKEYIYSIYPHCKENAEHFFDLMEKVEDMIPTIHSWAMGGYPYNHALNVFKELPFDKMDEPFVNELDSFSSFKSLLDDLDDDDLQDILNQEIDPTKIN